MPVFAIAVIAGVIFVVMAIFAIAHVVEWRQLQKIKAQPAGRPFCVLSLEQAFEADHAVLWDTQVPALQLICSAGSKGVPIQRLYACYVETTRHFPELYEGSNFGEWLAFLEESQLVARNEYRVAITSQGRRLLNSRQTDRLISA